MVDSGGIALTNLCKMHKIYINLLGNLNELLPVTKRNRSIQRIVNGNPSVKHLIESLGIPHTEVDLILVNHNPVGFEYTVKNNDYIEVFPYDNSPCKNEFCLQKRWDHAPGFLLDNHLGKLAKYLRIFGFDATYCNNFQDEELSVISFENKRVLLTRDRHLLMRKIITDGYLVRSKIPRYQLIEVIQRFDLQRFVSPFKRCLQCNGVLEPIRKEVILDQLQPLTKRYFNEFRLCKDCKKIYWKGSHYERMVSFIKNITKECN